VIIFLKLDVKGIAAETLIGMN